MLKGYSNIIKKPKFSISITEVQVTGNKNVKNDTEKSELTINDSVNKTDL